MVETECRVFHLTEGVWQRLVASDRSDRSLRNVSLMASSRRYEIDSSRSTWRLRVGDEVFPDVRGEISELNGYLTFDAEELSACRVDLGVATAIIGLEQISTKLRAENGDSSHTFNQRGVHFTSWRFREIGHREYWVPGALTIGHMSKLESLRLYGPTPEVTDANGNLRAGATAIAKIDISPIRLALQRTEQMTHMASTGEATLTVQIELVRRTPAEKQKDRGMIGVPGNLP